MSIIITINPLVSAMSYHLSIIIYHLICCILLTSFLLHAWDDFLLSIRSCRLGCILFTNHWSINRSNNESYRDNAMNHDRPSTPVVWIHTMEYHAVDKVDSIQWFSPQKHFESHFDWIYQKSLDICNRWEDVHPSNKIIRNESTFLKHEIKRGIMIDLPYLSHR